MTGAVLDRLRAIDVTSSVGELDTQLEAEILSLWLASGVKFVCSNGAHENRYYQAVRELLMCVKTSGSPKPILQEGGNYPGCWLESTGTINAELVSRFLPEVARATYETFANTQRDDGLFPYKIIAEGPFFFQIQLVTPLARCVWNHYAVNGAGRAFLEKMYTAMSRYDEWLTRHRNTQNTGAVEAFCCHDTGHDLSARFWHVPDKPYKNDPAQYDRNNPLLPFIAPDLTANVICQRFYLARIAEELGEDGTPWRDKAEHALNALFEHCFDAEDGFFYDRDNTGQLVKVQSDVLLRVLACEVGDDALFADALERYLLNTRKFFARYPLTSIALDDPRFDQNFAHNSWCGPTNLLTLIRTPHAFEAHHRHVELTWILFPALFALFHADRFAQTISPFTGEAGFTERYSPSILCLLDFVERLSGIMPQPDGTLWFTGLTPIEVEQMHADHDTGYSREVDGALFEWINTLDTSTAYRDGELLFALPRGVRVVTDRQGKVLSLIGMRTDPVSGTLKTSSGAFDFTIGANQQLDLEKGGWKIVRDIGLVTPRF